MNKTFFLTGLLICLYTLSLQAQSLSIVPLPESIEMGEGHLVLDQGTIIAAWSDDTRKSAAIFNEMLQAKVGFRLPVKIATPQNDASIVLQEVDDLENEEAYTLEINGERVFIKGSPKGIFYLRLAIHHW